MKLIEVTSIIEEGVVKLDKIADQIINDCQPYLKEIKNQPTEYILYRGLQKVRTFFTKINRSPGKERRPLNIDIEVHNKLNELFVQRFGWPARNGVFVTSDKILAKDYAASGLPHIFFPIGKYRYVWSPEVDDLFSYFYELTEFDPESEFPGENITDEMIKHVVETYRDTDLISAIQEQSEVSFDVSSYYVVRSSDVGKKVLDIIEEKLL